MKKIIITIVLLIAVNTIKAQGNLQFNAVKNIEITGNTQPYNPNLGVPISTIGTITVPSGKVWKIESTSVKENNSAQITMNTWTLLLNNHIAYSGDNNLSTNLPLWLSEGNYLVKIGYVIGSVNVIASISAIEFNIAP